MEYPDKIDFDSCVAWMHRYRGFRYVRFKDCLDQHLLDEARQLLDVTALEISFGKTSEQVNFNHEEKHGFTT